MTSSSYVQSAAEYKRCSARVIRTRSQAREFKRGQSWVPTGIGRLSGGTILSRTKELTGRFQSPRGMSCISSAAMIANRSTRSRLRRCQLPEEALLTTCCSDVVERAADDELSLSKCVLGVHMPPRQRVLDSWWKKEKHGRT
jgi:hypothetical protein